MSNRTILYGTVALAALSSVAQAQPVTSGQPADANAAPQAAATPLDDSGDEEEIVVTGQRARGSVVGDIPPEQTLDSRDVRATGATNINELLEALAPQLGSARGRGGERPVLLLNGQRISSFRELRDIPTEAIQRVDILPEEVALKYGYRAEQKVVNIVLRQRFRSTTAEVSGNVATEGGRAGGSGDLTRLMIQRNGRTTINLHAEGNGMLTENERDVALAGGADPARSAARSLLPSARQVRGTVTVNRQLGTTSATGNVELEHDEGRALLGLGDVLLLPLARSTASNSIHAGGVLNGNRANWRWTLTGNADVDESITKSDRDDLLSRDRSRQTASSADLTATANGKLFAVPAGDASATFRAELDGERLDAERRRAEVVRSTGLGRTTATGAVNVDLPISRRGRDFSALGNLTLNGNAEVARYSDAGTLTTIGAGANWSPLDRLNLLASWTREEGAPTIQQLGEPSLETPETRIFDFTRGETALVTAITGGNPDLRPDKRNVVKLGANWQPFEKTDLRLRADYVHSVIDRPISSLTATPAVEAAFPGRFVRDAGGRLVSADLRPVNFDQSRRDTLRIGFDFTKPLKSRQPSQALLDRMRAQFGVAGRPPGAQQPGGAGERPGGDRGGFGGRRGGGGGFGGRDRGRLQLSITDTVTFTDRVSIAPGTPGLDYLHGDAAGQSGGTPRHKVEAQAGWSNNGIGARLGADWRSGTRVSTLTGDDLRFSPLGTLDLRLFANLGEQPELVLDHPWLRGSSVRFEVSNLFDSKPRVRNAAGLVPLNYQEDLLDPLGRTVKITFRKLFLPSRSFFQRQNRQGSRSGGGED